MQNRFNENRFKVGQRVRFSKDAERSLHHSGYATVTAIVTDYLVKLSPQNKTFHESWIEHIPFEEYYKQLTR